MIFKRAETSGTEFSYTLFASVSMTLQLSPTCALYLVPALKMNFIIRDLKIYSEKL